MKKLSLVLMILGTFFFTACEEEVEIVQIKTDHGEMLVYLYDATPGHKANFMKLTKEGFYDGTTFHRIIQNFMIQGGDPNSKDNDPNNDGHGGPPFTGAEKTYASHDGKSYTIDAEIKPEIKHKFGSIAAARMGDNVNPQKRSSGSQFYIVVNKNGTPHLDNNYTVFGEVISGMEVAEKIVAQPKNQMDRPNQDIKMDVNIIKVKPSKLDKNYKWKMPEHK